MRRMSPIHPISLSLTPVRRKFLLIQSRATMSQETCRATGKRDRELTAVFAHADGKSVHFDPASFSFLSGLVRNRLESLAEEDTMLSISIPPRVCANSMITRQFVLHMEGGHTPNSTEMSPTGATCFLNLSRHLDVLLTASVRHDMYAPIIRNFYVERGSSTLVPKLASKITASAIIMQPTPDEGPEAEQTWEVASRRYFLLLPSAVQDMLSTLVPMQHDRMPVLNIIVPLALSCPYLLQQVRAYVVANGKHLAPSASDDVLWQIAWNIALVHANLSRAPHMQHIGRLRTRDSCPPTPSVHTFNFSADQDANQSIISRRLQSVGISKSVRVAQFIMKNSSFFEAFLLELMCRSKTTSPPFNVVGMERHLRVGFNNVFTNGEWPRLGADVGWNAFRGIVAFAEWK